MSPMLELRDVEEHFPVKSAFLKRKIGEVRAVDGVSLTIDRGVRVE